MSANISTYIPTGNASGTRARDQDSFPFLAVPQAMTMYAKFIERGTATVTNGKVIYIGTAAGTGAWVALMQNGATHYKMNHNNGTTQVSSGTASVAVGNGVELRGTLDATGAVTVGMTINGGAETVSASSAANTLQQTWGAQTLWMNSNGTGAVGFLGLLACAVVRGVQSLDTMRRIAGTHTRNG